MGSHKSTFGVLGDVKPFLEENNDLGPATRKKMLNVLQNPQKMHCCSWNLPLQWMLDYHLYRLLIALKGMVLLS